MKLAPTGLAVVAITALTHVAASLAAAFALAAAYPHRMADIRSWPGEADPARTADFVSGFVEEIRRRSIETLFVGSSVTFGYPWQEPVIFSRQYAALRPEEPTANLSIIGAHLGLMEDVLLCRVLNGGVKLKTIVIEIPVVNGVGYLDQRLPPPPPCDARIGGRSYAWFTLTRPIGIGWVPFIRDRLAYPKADEHIALQKVPEGYFVVASRFAAIEAEFRERVRNVTRAATRVAERVYVFPSPVYLPGASEMGEDATAISQQIDAAVDACDTVEGAVCLRPDEFLTLREAYYNMTHFNQRGHRAFAEWLAASIPPHGSALQR